MTYVDGFVVAVPKDRLVEYERLAERAGLVWRDHGALAYVECLADDVPDGLPASFSRAVQAREGEIVVFSFIVYPSRIARDAILEKAMADPRLMGEADALPFDAARMIKGGFTAFVELRQEERTREDRCEHHL